MMGHPFALSDEQLNLALDAAKRIPSRWRVRFLEAVADWLLSVDVITNDDVRCRVLR